VYKLTKNVKAQKSVNSQTEFKLLTFLSLLLSPLQGKGYNSVNKWRFGLPKACCVSHNDCLIILNVETVARSRLFNVESVDLEFSNGVRRVYERMRPSTREAVMIVPIVDDHIILIREYAVGTESYELGFSKGLIDPGETVDEAANRELKEEVGFGANKLTFLKKLSMAPSYFSSKMNILVAEDLYPESLPGDEPEPLPQVRWPLAQLMSLLDEEDFNEARNVSALFLVREWLQAQGRL